jgi:hypothetical protein
VAAVVPHNPCSATASAASYGPLGYTNEAGSFRAAQGNAASAVFKGSAEAELSEELSEENAASSASSCSAKLESAWQAVVYVHHDSSSSSGSMMAVVHVLNFYFEKP